MGETCRGRPRLNLRRDRSSKKNGDFTGGNTYRIELARLQSLNPCDIHLKDPQDEYGNWKWEIVTDKIDNTRKTINANFLENSE